MSKISSVIVLGILLALPLFTGAQIIVDEVEVKGDVTVSLIVTAILNWAFGLLLAIAALFIIYAAFLYLTSGGDEEKVKKARQWIVYAVIAIIIAFLARAIVAIVRQLLQVPL